MNVKQFFLIAALATNVACHTNAECPCPESTKSTACSTCPEECSKKAECPCPESAEDSKYPAIKRGRRKYKPRRPKNAKYSDPFQAKIKNPTEKDVCDLLQNRQLAKYTDAVELHFRIERAKNCDKKTWQKIINSVADCAKNCKGKSQDEFNIAPFVNIINTGYETTITAGVHGYAQVELLSESAKGNRAITLSYNN